MEDSTKRWDIAAKAARLSSDEIIKVRLCYMKHKRHRVAHEEIAGPGYKLMSFVQWLRIVVKLRVAAGELLPVDSPSFVQDNRGVPVTMPGDFMARRDTYYAPKLGWFKATIHCRRRRFATATVRSGVHMAAITKAIRHSQGVTMQYVALSIAEKVAVTTRYAIAS